MYYGQVFSLRKMYLQFSQNLVFRRDCHFFLFLFFPGRRIASLLVKYLSLCCLLHMRMNLCHNSNGYLYSWKGKFTITKSLSNSASPPPPLVICFGADITYFFLLGHPGELCTSLGRETKIQTEHILVLSHLK